MKTLRLNAITCKIFTLFILIFCIEAPLLPASPDNKEIVVSASRDAYPPFLIWKDKNILGGFIMDMLNPIAAKLGYKVVTQKHPSKRTNFLFKQGKVDIRIKAKEWVRDPNQYVWSDSIVMMTDVLVFPADKPVVFNEVKDLTGLTLGTGLGYRYPTLTPYFEDKRIRRQDTKKISSRMNMVLYHRIDASIENKLVALWIFKRFPEFKDKLILSEKPIDKPAGYRLMFTKKHNWEPFAKQFNHELSQMKNDGRLSKIFKKYQ